MSQFSSDFLVFPITGGLAYSPVTVIGVTVLGDNFRIAEVAT